MIHEGYTVQKNDVSSHVKRVSTQIKPEINSIPSASTFEPTTVKEKSEIESSVKNDQKRQTR